MQLGRNCRRVSARLAAAIPGRREALLIAAPGVFRDQLAAQLAARRRGSDIITAGNAAEARTAIGDSLFSFAVIDDAMPGEEAVILARTLEEEGFSAPILLLSPAEKAGRRTDCRGFG